MSNTNNTTKMTKQDYETISLIIDRSEEMGIGFGDRITRFMDIEFAHKEFNLRLEEFLNAKDFDFVHDFCGIQKSIDRRNLKWNDDCFVPRFTTPDLK